MKPCHDSNVILGREIYSHWFEISARGSNWGRTTRRQNTGLLDAFYSLAEGYPAQHTLHLLQLNIVVDSHLPRLRFWNLRLGRNRVPKWPVSGPLISPGTTANVATTAKHDTPESHGSKTSRYDGS